MRQIDPDNLKKEVKVPARVLEVRDPRSRLNIVNNIKVRAGVFYRAKDGKILESEEQQLNSKAM